LPAKDSDQVAFSNAEISPDHRSVGWLRLYPNCCTSYPIPLALVVRTEGRDRVFEGRGLPIWDWTFLGSQRVAYRQAPVHGLAPTHYELHGLRTGGLISSFDAEPDTGTSNASTTSLPDWVRALERKRKAPSPPNLQLQSAESPTTTLHDFRNGLAGVHSNNPAMRLHVALDSVTHTPVLQIDFPAASGDPAARDVYLGAESRDWSTGHAVIVRVRPTQAIRVSISFLDRNRVAYTTWFQLRAAVWQTLRIPFSDFKPNPYFQPPDARRGAALDVTDVSGIGLAPQGPAAGRLAISGIFVVR
jgi:hypothetical protein